MGDGRWWGLDMRDPRLLVSKESLAGEWGLEEGEALPFCLNTSPLSQPHERGMVVDVYPPQQL